MARYKDFFNEVTNDGRIFSYEDVINIPLDEDEFYREALDYQYRKIGFPPSAVLDKSDEVSQIGHFIYEDGSEPRAHYRSKMGEKFIDPKRPFMTTPTMERARVNMGIENTPVLKGGIEHNESAKYQWKTEDGACEECKSLDGKKYASKKDIPAQPHPNCKCKVEKIKKKVEKQIPIPENELEQKMKEFFDFDSKLKNIQYKFPQNPASSAIESSALDYYRIALTHGNSIDTVNKENIRTTVDKIKNEQLKQHLLKIKGVKKDSMVVIPKQNARIIEQIKKSKEFKDIIKEQLKNNSIKTNNSEIIRLDYISKNPFKYGKIASDLALTIGHTHLYNTHFDKEGNLYTILVDWYDFDKFKENDIFDKINNNAYEQQERGDLMNYVLVIPIVLTKTEVDNL